MLLLLDGHPPRFNFIAMLILYLFDVDVALISPHTSHLLQVFDVSVASQENLRNDNDLLKNYCLNTESTLKELFGKENGWEPSEEDFTINLRVVVRKIKESKIEESKSLSNLRPLVVEDGSDVIIN